ncbi:MAG: hypothetical protein CSA66_04885 [Proteobacteria bacterium]|nr:MAG: hypothetical protein CSA66_04885 [Pseudomonadota bacterium]
MAEDDQTKGGDETTEGQAAGGLADALKRSFTEYVHKHEVVPKQGEQQLNLDLAFIRDHGGPLVAHMLKDLTKTLLPDNLSFSVPADQTKPEGQDSGGVTINFDLKDALGKLMQPQKSDAGEDR